MNVSFWFEDKEYRLNLREKSPDTIQVALNGKTFDVSVEFLSSDQVLLNIDGRVYDVFVSTGSRSYSVGVNGRCYDIGRKSASQILGNKAGEQRRRDVKTSMPGKIVNVLVGNGDRVDEGQAVLILEAMKMQNEIKSPQEGTVTQILPKAGDSVEAGALLFTVE